MWFPLLPFAVTCLPQASPKQTYINVCFLLCACLETLAPFSKEADPASEMQVPLNAEGEGLSGPSSRDSAPLVTPPPPFRSPLPQQQPSTPVLLCLFCFYFLVHRVGGLATDAAV